nr:unnamed protein product [Callosobruchus chinensis]
MESQGVSLGEFLIFPVSQELQPKAKEKDAFVASRTITQTKVLLDIYKKYRKKVGSLEIENFKKLWELIAKEINDMLKTSNSPNHVENRWRVVERAYKRFVDNKNKTGRISKIFEFQEQMDDMKG